MTDFLPQQPLNGLVEPQCQYFVLRKKRLCRMTVRPGRQYCGEHEPQPKTTDGQDDTRIPCPNDPKHTVYVSKLEKHLLICNARAREQPPYIVPNINAPTEVDTCLRKPLSHLPRQTIMQVIDKVNFLYDKHVKDNITTAPEYPIHSSVMEEFSESDRAESSLRHLRQVSSLLWLAEGEGLVAPNTCYVELGAGKGHVSYYSWQAWCGSGGSALLLDRASLRHKRDNALRGRAGLHEPHVARLRADLAHVALQHVPHVARADAAVGLAKHLCGVATDYALRCITAEGVLHKTRGLVLATCCHHRCERAAFFANNQLKELGISSEEFNVMLGIVSWATCGDGRPRRLRIQPAAQAERAGAQPAAQAELAGTQPPAQAELAGTQPSAQAELAGTQPPAQAELAGTQPPAQVELAGTQPPAQAELAGTQPSAQAELAGTQPPAQAELAGTQPPAQAELAGTQPAAQAEHAGAQPAAHPELASAQPGELPDRLVLGAQVRSLVGRRAKLLLDWARVLELRARGLDARLLYFVPAAVSLENVCIVAKKLS